MATLNVKNFPEELYHQLQALATQEHRSVAQEVVHLLDRAVGESKQTLSVLGLRGLGREVWQGIDGSAYLERERQSWDAD